MIPEQGECREYYFSPQNKGMGLFGKDEKLCAIPLTEPTSTDGMILVHSVDRQRCNENLPQINGDAIVVAYDNSGGVRDLDVAEISLLEQFFSDDSPDE